MGVNGFELVAHPPEPTGEIPPLGFAALRHTDALEEFTEGKERGILAFLLETVGVIQVAGALREIGGMGDIQHLAVGVLELFQGQRSFAAAGRTHHNQWRRQAVNHLLGIIKGDDLVQHVDFTPIRMDVAHRFGILGRLCGFDRL